jgi:hypothetical protein
MVKMRSIKLTAALVAAATSLTLSCAAASARGHHGPRAGANNGNCHVKLNVAPRLITSGESVLAFGQLRCPVEAQAANQTVTLYERSASSGYSVAGTTTTDTHGFYQLTATNLTANSLIYVTAGTTQSGKRDVKVAAQVTLSGPPEGVVPSTLRTGHHNMVTFTGTVSPQDEGALVILQRQNAIRGNEWHRIGRATTVGAGGTFTITHTFRYPGDANIRVVVRSPENIPSASNVLDYEIVQAQNPQLTIESSANPISYGQSTTIKGVLAGKPNTPVQLLARTAQQSSFTLLAEAKTDATGAYTFAPQTPLQSTFYRVQGAGRKSAVLYEGVKYVLSAGVSATSVESGQSVTFSGTVTPDEAGHVVYLERENAAGTGFHVIQVGEVSSNSTYSIVHAFYNVGTSVVRIKVPGGPFNGTTDSTPFTITVTPAPAGALAPEAPGNSTQPPEGQL